MEPHALDPMPRDRLLARLRDARFSPGLACPRCAGRRVHRWGRYAGRQRYRCCGCRRTFSDLTGTPAAYLKRLEWLPAYGHCLAAGLSVRRTAALLGLDPSTVFRWRHRLWAWQLARDRATAAPLGGCVELYAHRWPHSCKGARPPDRPSRRRGLGAGGPFFPGRRVHLVVACDRQGGVLTVAHPPDGRGTLQSTLTPAAVAEALHGRLRPGAQPMALHPAFLAWGRTHHRRTGLTCRPVRGPGARRLFDHDPRAARRLLHVRTAWAYLQRLRPWLRRFRGVASKYLPHYLLWHRRVDAPHRRPCATTLLWWPQATID